MPTIPTKDVELNWKPNDSTMLHESLTELWPDWREKVEDDFEWGMARSHVIGNTISHIEDSLTSTNTQPNIDNIRLFVKQSGGWKHVILQHITKWRENYDKVMPTIDFDSVKDQWKMFYGFYLAVENDLMSQTA